MFSACAKLPNPLYNVSINISYPEANVTWDDRVLIGSFAEVSCILPWKNDTTEVMYRTCDALDAWNNDTLPICRLS